MNQLMFASVALMGAIVPTKMPLRKATILVVVVCMLCLQVGVVSAQRVIHVDDDAPAGGDGLSWATAYDSLDSGLTAAEPGDQTWVAAGTYVGNFTLALEVGLYGGFAGTETELAQRDWTGNPTILDGNQTGSVVTSPPGATETTRIDGFTITNGLANNGGGMYLDHSFPTITNNTITDNTAYRFGGGLYTSDSSPMIANNTVSGNSASYGGGMYLRSSSPRIVNNTIMGNSAPNGAGGGLIVSGSAGTIVNNTITGNSALLWGGGLSLDDSSSTRIANNTITGNSAGWGGGLHLTRYSSPAIANNTITDNRADFGGGLYLEYSAPTIANNTIKDNMADYGGGIYNTHSSPTLTNCTFAGNSAANGRALVCYSTQQAYPSTVEMANCILRDGGNEIWNGDDSTITVSYSCVQDEDPDDDTVYPGEGNIDDDPLFVLNPDPGPDGTWGTEDDELGDLHLSSGSPCIDAGDNTAVPIDVLTDLDGRPRFMNDPAVPDTGYGTRPIVDMGAYERQAVLLDIHPGRCPNRFNIRSNARVQMAVVGTDAFDVTQIDTDSLVLERADGLGGSLTPWDQGHGNTISVGDAAVPFYGDLCDCQSDRRDGIDDLVLRFSTRDIVRQLELCGIGPKTQVMLTVRGQLLDGTPFDASDCILTIGGRPPAPGRLSSRDGKD